VATRTKNQWAKTRDVNDPYFTAFHNGWTWKILKAYSTGQKARLDRYARYFCAVQSPMTFGGWDFGDVYVHEIPGSSRALAQQCNAENLKVVPT
jgi:hypothetical protein